MTADGCPPSEVEALRTQVVQLQVQLSEARETNARLNRRCQLAERAANEKITASTGSLGRGLANYAADMFRRRADELQGQLEAARRALEWYANEKNYDEDGAPGKAVFSSSPGEPAEYDFDTDMGTRARAALATLEAGEL